MCRAYLAWVLAEQGEFNEAIAHGQEALRLAEAVDHPYSLIIACRGLAYVRARKGEPREAVPLLERSLALCRDWNLTL